MLRNFNSKIKRENREKNHTELQNKSRGKSALNNLIPMRILEMTNVVNETILKQLNMIEYLDWTKDKISELEG